MRFSPDRCGATFFRIAAFSACAMLVWGSLLRPQLHSTLKLVTTLAQFVGYVSSRAAKLQFGVIGRLQRGPHNSPYCPEEHLPWGPGQAG